MPLYSADGVHLWTEYAPLRRTDVIALPVPRSPDVRDYPLDRGLATTDLVVPPAEPVAIIGFPFGMAASGKFPVWKTGHIASEIDLDYEGEPVFLIDATAKPGMSGSPVLAVRRGWVQTSRGITMGGAATRFLGVYSGATHSESDVGVVWKPSVIDAVLRKSGR